MKTRSEILARQQEILDLARSENRDLNEEETREFDDLTRKLDALDGDGGTPDDDDPMQRAIELERARVADITDLCRSFEMNPDEYVRSGESIDSVRTKILNKLKDTRTPINARTGDTGDDRFRRDLADAMVLKSGVEVKEASDSARKFQGMSLRSMAEECLMRDGMSDGEVRYLSMDELLMRVCGQRQYFNPTAAFPAILDQSIKKSIVELYNEVPTSFQRWTTKGSLSDFKSTSDHEYVMGGAGEFLKVGKNGELKHDTLENKAIPERRLETYGRQFSMTRQAFINDDVSFLSKVPGKYAQSAKRTIDKQVYSVLMNNIKFADGKNIFGADHGNMVRSGSAPTQKAIQEMILMMQKQKDQFGEAIYMTPKYILVPVGYGFDLDVILHSAQVTGSNNNDKNPLYNYPIEVVETPVLNALSNGKAVPWFLVSDRNSANNIQVDYLNGVEIPTIRRMETPGVLGFTWDIYLDWGISVRDYRGMVMNPGVVMA